ncbi:anion permease [Lactobacillus sp. DCY120]|uniref:Anion permease n=1 Tax=Bombilactobacillus apium TaxID=2675299 RepID=A0A850QYZ1_9LACO|nr:SLC13 family permease [Bombilactobacillus apium]NVY95913.1 anion permease [Bombilactobacillus apium]
MGTVFRRIISDKIFNIALVCAGLSFLVGTPQVTEINWNTIGTLLSLMIGVQLLRAMHILDALSDWLLVKSQHTRQMTQFFILLAFCGSMFLTNDIAILTLIPTFMTLAHHQKGTIAYPLTLIVIAANLGSSFTHIGNPQNLFLVTYYHVNILTFFQLSIPLMIASLILLAVLSLWIPKNSIAMISKKSVTIHARQISITTGLIGFIMLGIFNLVPILLVIIVTVVVGLIIDRHVFQHVDYALLLTFVCFFLFVSALSHNLYITHWLNQLMKTPQSIYVTSLATSQVISNVPAAILLTHFTHYIPALFLGVNIGGLGSSVASLANLLAVKQLLLFNGQQSLWYFLKVFTILNLIGLFILGIWGWLYLKMYA